MRLHPVSLHRAGAKALGIFTRGCSLFHSHAAQLRCVGVHGLVCKGLLSSGCMQALHAPSSAAYLFNSTKSSWRKCHGKLTGGSLPAEPTVLPLYAGAYGTVYKALRDGVQVVAVKKFHHLDDPRQQRSIMKEVSILKGCRSVTDQKLELGCICMVMSLAGEGLSR